MALKCSSRLEDQAAARAAQGLVGGGGDHVAVGHRAGVHAAGHQAGDVGHVEEQHGLDLVGDAPQLLVVPEARIGAGAAHQHLGALGAWPARADGRSRWSRSSGLHLVVHGLEHQAREVDRMAVGEVAAVAEAQAHDLVPGLQERPGRPSCWPWSHCEAARWPARPRTVPWPAAWPGSRPRPRARSRRSSACPG